MEEAARRIHGLGPSWVLVKGGGLPGVPGPASGAARADVVDVLFDGDEVTLLVAGRVDTTNTHGTGCSLSAAIAGYLAWGAAVPTAVASAKSFVHDGLVSGARWHLGRGHGPLDHLGWSGRPPPGQFIGRPAGGPRTPGTDVSAP